MKINAQEEKEYRKRFPATTELESLTFLNDKKVNGELYAIFQQLSYAVETEEGYETIVYKQTVPKQSVLCEKLGIKSPKTLKTHLDYLIEKGYIQKLDNGDYLLPKKEDIYFLIPLETLRYLNDNCKEHIVKIYVYLGQRYRYGLKNGFMYEFTSEELGEHIGIKVKNNSRGYQVINNALDLLCNSGLIDYCEYFDGTMQKKKLTKFSLEHIKK